MDILVLYYSVQGSVRRMAELVAEGIEREPGARARLRTVPRVSPVVQKAEPQVPPDGAPYAELKDLEECAGLALGAPTRFGNLPAAMKYFWDGTAPLWMKGALAGKPACVFTSTGTMHGGQETTLLTMMLPLLHHGMVIVGLPYTHPELNATRSGGSPYGATHVAGNTGDLPVTPEERTLCVAQGLRLAQVARRLAS